MCYMCNFPDGNEALRHIVKDAEELQVGDIKIKEC